ncbi:DoxX family protein [Streptomyces sp. XM83C]|jgi:putative oxidoreductase|uniref:DoxX family protein n=1 Tax=Streptomyces thermocoprophilus TaxID=78356 RepID=A0ABV5VMU2_9ACTN|nr:DoxX family protein [Streptomyces sp. XM83C]MCK1823750.1 DoxX family protein [Streptomyces sp. XM83C]
MTGRLNSAQPYVLGLFRIVIGLLFACHGAASLFGVLGGAVGTDGGTIPSGTWPGWYAALIQLVCGGLVLLGLGTRPAALLASGSMAYAYFDVHQSNGLFPIQNGGEAAAMFCWGFLLLMFSGSGAFALDQVIRRGDLGSRFRGDSSGDGGQAGDREERASAAA